MNDFTPNEISQAVAILKKAPQSVFAQAYHWYREYQEHLDAWPQYAECVRFGTNPRSPLPHGQRYFDFDDETHASVVKRMAEKLNQAKRTGLSLADEDIRQAAFSDTLAEENTERFIGVDRQRRRIWDAYALVDEGAYRGLLRWDALERKRGERELGLAWARCK